MHPLLLFSAALLLLSRAAAFVAPAPPLRHRARAVHASDLYLGIDCGTQGLKAIVYDAAAKATTGVGSVAYGLRQDAATGLAEQDPATWVEAMYAATNAALDAAGPGARAAIAGVGVSGQQHGLVALDAEVR